MLENKLKLNSGKTEIIVFSSSYRPRPTLNNLGITTDTVDCSTIAKNIGVIFNKSLSMLPHVTAVYMKVFFFFSSTQFFKDSHVSFSRYMQKSNSCLCYSTIVTRCSKVSQNDLKTFAECPK